MHAKGICCGWDFLTWEPFYRFYCFLLNINWILYNILYSFKHRRVLRHALPVSQRFFFIPQNKLVESHPLKVCKTGRVRDIVSPIYKMPHHTSLWILSDHWHMSRILAVLEHHTATPESIIYKTTHVTFSFFTAQYAETVIRSDSRASTLVHTSLASFTAFFGYLNPPPRITVSLSGIRTLHSSIRSENTKSARFILLALFHSYLFFSCGMDAPFSDFWFPAFIPNLFVSFSADLIDWRTVFGICLLLRLWTYISFKHIKEKTLDQISPNILHSHVSVLVILNNIIRSIINNGNVHQWRFFHGIGIDLILHYQCVNN